MTKPKKHDDETLDAAPEAQQDRATTQPPTQKPTIGRTVHYRKGETVEAAMITRVHSDTCVNLTVFPDQDTPRSRRESSAVLVAADGTDSGWYWPPRV